LQAVFPLVWTPRESGVLTGEHRREHAERKRRLLIQKKQREEDSTLLQLKRSMWGIGEGVKTDRRSCVGKCRELADSCAAQA
jgi:hypothetical protein